MIVKFNVTVESQPAAFVKTFVYAPEAVYVVPFSAHVYESHAVADVDDDVGWVIVKFNVIVESQPAAFGTTFV